jgi:DsrE/DsrF-like family
MLKLVLLVTREGLGQVDPTERPFGVAMFDRFLHAMESQPIKPDAICFYTEGVKLLCKGSPAALGLGLLQGMGVRLLACRTCIEHFQLTDKICVGEICGMNDIVTLLLSAEKVVTI